MPVGLPDNLREFDDADKTRELIYGNVMDSLKKRFPIEDDEYRLELDNPHYDGPQTFNLEQQKRALMTDRQLRASIKGKWRLIHKPSNQVLEEKEDVVMHVPYLTARNTFIYGGNEYTVVNQSRLKPGVYTRRRRTGEVESQFNVKPGTGKGFHIRLEPETGLFKLSIDQSNIPLVPLLHTLGVTDQDLVKAWGAELYENNLKKRDAKAIPKIYERFSGYKFNPQASEEEQKTFIRENLAKFELDPDVVARTLGLADTTGVTPQTLIRATQKLLNVSKGSEDQDDRDSTMFSNIYAVEDLIQERIDKDAGKLARTLLYKARRDKSLRPVARGALDNYIYHPKEGLLLGSGLSMPLEETNPLHVLEQSHRITKLGVGGIGSAEAVTDEARNVNNSQLGFVDPIMGPEGTNIGIDVRAAYKTYKGKDKRMYGEFRAPGTTTPMYLAPEDAFSKVIAFPGEMAKPGDMAVAMVNGKIKKVAKKDVQLEVPSFAHMMASHTNLNPMPTSVQPGRQFYGAKFWSQYMPLVEGEVPLVDSLTPEGKETFSEYYGKKTGTMLSKAAGIVAKVKANEVTIIGDDGTVQNIELVKDFPFNRLTGITYSPAVQPGDRVNVGDIVAHSNFTDKKSGAINMGRNLRTAIIPARGHSVSGDTNVLSVLPDDTCVFGPIRDIQLNPGVKAYALATKPLKDQQLDIYGYMEHKAESQLCEVTTMDGMKIKATLCHSFVTISESGDALVPIKAEDMIKGATFVPVIQPVLPHSDVITRVHMQSSGKTGKELSVQLDHEFGVVVGLYVAEGCVNYRDGNPHCVIIACVEPEIVEHLKRWCATYGINTNYKHTILENGNRHGALLIHSAALATWFSKWGRYAWGKRVPDVVWSAHRSFTEGFISGYWSGDGTVSNTQCTATTTSRILADGICLLLGSMGIRATYREYDNGILANRVAYQIHVYREFLSKFPAVLLKYKHDAIVTLSQLKISFSRDRIPVPKTCLAAVRKACGHKMPRATYMSRTWLKRFYLQLPEVLQKLIDAPVWWDIVQDVVPCEAEPYVYDLDMRPLSNFAVGSGWIVHNSYEDAYVISESAAKKLATERLYGYDQENRGGVEISRNKFISSFPDLYTRDQIAKLGEDGVAPPGTILNKGDPIILATGPKLLTSADAQLGKLHKVLRNTYTDKSVIWDNVFPGMVTDAAVTANGARVNIKSTPPVQVGDKLSTRFGLKGVVGKIMPDDDMPREPATNAPYELMLNPMGVLSRVAPNQVIEMSLGKLAKHTGQQVRLPQLPPPEGWQAWAEKQLQDAGVSETGDLFDPATGKTIKAQGDGYVYVSAFHHLAEKKLSHRGEEGAYTIDEQPAKGGHTGAKRFSMMDSNAALAHGATEVVKDAMTIRGTKNEDYWKALKLGRELPEPTIPFVYDKFLNTLKAGGINIVDKGDSLGLMPMIDKDVDTMSKGEIKNSDMITSDFEPIPGGLFDMGTTGGMAGNRWAHITLKEPLPNPVMEEPVRRILGLTVKQMRNVLAGSETIDGISGGRGISDALKKVDIDAAIEDHLGRVKRLRGSNRDNSVKVLGYLTAAKKQGVHPSDWVINKIPVIPPMFRPIARLGDIALKTDLNELYRDLIETNKSIGELRKDMPETALAAEKLNLYDAVTAVYGLGDPITPEGQSRRVKGAIAQVIGSNPKFGLFQSKVLSKTVSGVGRGVVTPDPNLDMDSIGIPEDSAWALYKDFVTRRLVRKGFPSLRAIEMIDKRTPEAMEMLQAEMQSRPVLVNRAPVWHKFNLLAFYPHISEGHVIRVSPLITKGFTMDFDGDQANFHVPISEKAVEQAKDKMLPSRNLFSLTDLKSIRHSPSMEMSMGLYQLTRDPTKKPPVRFASIQDAQKAYKEGRIGLNDPIIVP